MTGPAAPAPHPWVQGRIKAFCDSPLIPERHYGINATFTPKKGPFKKHKKWRERGGIQYLQEKELLILFKRKKFIIFFYDNMFGVILIYYIYFAGKQIKMPFTYNIKVKLIYSLLLLHVCTSFRLILKTIIKFSLDS